jgi:hypothetical protein
MKDWDTVDSVADRGTCQRAGPVEYAADRVPVRVADAEKVRPGQHHDKPADEQFTDQYAHDRPTHDRVGRDDETHAGADRAADARSVRRRHHPAAGSGERRRALIVR